jgi:hypothetical protein
MAQVMNFERLGSRELAAPLIAQLSLSVPQEVKMISWGFALMHSAITQRASSVSVRKLTF